MPRSSPAAGLNPNCCIPHPASARGHHHRRPPPSTTSCAIMHPRPVHQPRRLWRARRKSVGEPAWSSSSAAAPSMPERYPRQRRRASNLDIPLSHEARPHRPPQRHASHSAPTAMCLTSARPWHLAGPRRAVRLAWRGLKVGSSVGEAGTGAGTAQHQSIGTWGSTSLPPALASEPRVC